MPRGRGRPPRRRRRHPDANDSAQPSAVVAPLASISAVSDTDDLHEDLSTGIPLTGEAARYALLVAQAAGRTPVIAMSSAANRRLFLNPVPHTPDSHWALLASIPVENLAAWFDDQNNDFNPYEMVPPQDDPASLAVLVHWIGHPGDSPRDPRARQCFIRWNDPRPPEIEIQRAISRKAPVLRWVLYCAGIHNMDFTEEVEDPEAESGDDELSNQPAPVDDLPMAKIQRWKECDDRVKLHCEVYPDDLSKVFIWQQNTHNDVPLEDRKHLKFSRQQRTLFLESLRLHGVKVSTLVLESNRTHFSTFGRNTPLPEFRKAIPTQLQSLYVSIKHRALLDRNPWRATHLLRQQNAEKIFAYTPHDFSRPDSESEFTIGLTDDYSLDSAIAHTLERMLGSDQCWRNKSENRAAMSLLCTIDERGHMVPVSVFISANAKRKTILAFLVGTYEKVVERARAIVADPTCVTTRNRTDKIVRQLIQNAYKIVSLGWVMAGIMIDKHFPSLGAIKDFIKLYNLKIYIRICQFHVVQCILRLEWDDGQKGLSVVLSLDLRYHIICLFRVVQRARTQPGFELLKEAFWVSLRALIVDNVQDLDQDNNDDADEDDEEPQTAQEKEKGKGSRRARGKPLPLAAREAMFHAVQKYFKKNWFVPAWIEHYTDIGMPPDQSRDGTWNTNNWTESAFKTFDSVFLENRQNKRIDRLASTILNDFLPYYQYWSPRDRKPPQDVIQLHFDAYTLWDSGAVRETGDGKYEVDIVSDGRVLRFEVSLKPLRCFCKNFEQSGKECLHILGARLLNSNGGVQHWHAVESKSEELVRKLRAQANRKKVTSDVVERRNLYTVLDKLAASDLEERQRMSHSPEPAFEPTLVDTGNTSTLVGMGRHSGRPLNSTPLHPGRTTHSAAMTHSPRFSKTPGRPPAGRLSSNSVFSAALRPLLAQQRQQIDDGNLWEEELEMESGQVQRWGALAYTMRAEEMRLWVTILNRSAIAERDGWFFICCDPICLTRDIIDSLDWTVELTAEELRAKRLAFIAEILEEREDIQILHVVCFHLYAEHWTIFHHDLTGTSPVITRLNPLRRPRDYVFPTESNVGFSIEDQVVFRNYIDDRRNIYNAQGAPVGKPKRFQAYYVDKHLGLQRTDSTTCGFWSVFVAFSMLLEISLDAHIVRDMDQQPVILKEVLAPIYEAFRADPKGVPLDLVQQLFHRFSPRVDYSTLEHLERFSLRPSTISRADEPAKSSLLQPPSPASTTHTTHPVLDVDIAHFLSNDPDAEWQIGIHTLTAVDLQDLVERNTLGKAVVDIYLHLFVRDMEARGTPHPTFLIVHSLISDEIKSQPRNGSNIQGMAPKRDRGRESRMYWFPQEDIFILDWLLIPWWWVKQWFIVAVEFRKHSICVYDPTKSNGKGGKPTGAATSRGKAATERVLQMLRFEHLARYGAALGSGWSDAVQLLDVPQSAASVDPGVLVVWFSQQLALGNTDTSLWTLSTPDSHLEKERIVNRISEAIFRDSRRRKTDTSNLSGTPSVSYSTYRHSLCIFESMHPTLESTDPRRMPSHDQWNTICAERFSKPRIGSCILLFGPGPGDIAFPALVKSFDSDNVTLVWFSGIHSKIGPAPSTEFSIPWNTWETTVYGCLTCEKIIPINWPGLLVDADSFFPSPVYPYQQILDTYLQKFIPDIVSLYQDATDTVANEVFNLINTRFSSSNNPQQFYKEFLGAGPGDEPFCAADERHFTFLETKIRQSLPWQVPVGSQPEEVGRRMREWCSGAARSMLATAAASHFLSVDLATACELLNSRQVCRAHSEVEQVWEAYGWALRDESLLKVMDTCQELQVITPGIHVAFPSRR